MPGVRPPFGIGKRIGMSDRYRQNGPQTTPAPPWRLRVGTYARLVAVCGLLLGGITVPAGAASGPWAQAEIGPNAAVDGRLVAAVDGVGDLEAVPAGLHVLLPTGWKTYWRSPGDAGLPPSVDWSASRNVAAVDVAWPAPHRFQLFGLETFGYEHEVVFPLTVTPEQTGAPVHLAGTADLLVCSDVCVPAVLDLTLDVPAGAASADPIAANLIARYRAQVPDDGSGAGVSVTDAAASRIDGTPGLTVRARAEEPFQTPDVLVEGPEGWAFAAPAVMLDADGRTLTARIAATQWPGQSGPQDAPDTGGREAGTLTGAQVTLTLLDGARTAERTVAVAAAADTVGRATGGPGGAGLSIWPVLGFAVLGGLILNLMPCVLPVLSLKLLSVIQAGGESRSRIRGRFLASAAGILASFLALAGAAIAVQSAGGAVGWGMQFQQPVFIAFMVTLLTLFACNLFGLFEIILPSGLQTRLGLAGATAEQRGGSLAGDFVTGAFATLLATPCSAPFLGTAVAFALSRGSAEILAVFSALGLGLALPYLAIAAAPALARAMPRPGRWMLRVKQGMALALLATAAWLLSVLAAQVTPATALLLTGVLAALAALLYARRAVSAPGMRVASSAAAGLLALAAVGVPAVVGPGGAPSPASPAPGVGGADAIGQPATARTAWTHWDPEAVAHQVAAGRTVFVDVTADWCITCKANKTLVIDRGGVADRLAAETVVAMQADWTRPDPAIADFLASHGRYGIPFNIVYGPGAPDGITLPEILRQGVVLDALDRAAGS